MNNKTTIISFLIFICTQTSGQVDSIFLKHFGEIVKYDSVQAKIDLSKDSIFILVLSGLGHSGDPFSEYGEIEYVEQRFGFKYKYEHFEVPFDFVFQKQNEYNNQVYKYLDSLRHIDSENEIILELIRLAFERIYTVNQSDKDIRRYIKRNFRKETKEFKTKLINADIYYRNRQFKYSLEKYENLEDLAITIKGKDYILTSKYHCLMNLEEFELAKALCGSNINRRIKRNKH